MLIADDLARPAIEVAPQLLGMILRCGERAGRIVEVEAYGAADDEASHAFRGRTARNTSMFGPPGSLYVYLSYGIHRCANIVCGPEGEASAVLLRALEPVDGLAAMAAARPRAKRVIDYCNGPGKLAAALGINETNDGQMVVGEATAVRLEIDLSRQESGASESESSVTQEVVFGPRVGITKAVARPWRFALDGNPHVSTPRGGMQTWHGQDLG